MPQRQKDRRAIFFGNCATDSGSGVGPPPSLTDVGSNVTTMMSATASAASVQDRARTRRERAFWLGPETTSSPVTPPDRSSANLASTEVAALWLTKWMRAERDATRATMSLRDVQPGTAWTSRRTVVPVTSNPAASAPIWMGK